MVAKELILSKLWLIKESMLSSTFLSSFDPNWTKMGHFKANLAIKMSNITVVNPPCRTSTTRPVTSRGPENKVLQHIQYMLRNE